MAASSSSSSQQQQQAPTSQSWSTLGFKFNIDGGKPPTLPAHYWPLDTYVLPKIKALTSSSSEPVKVLILAGGTGAELQLLMEGLEREKIDKARVKVCQTDCAQGMLSAAEEMVKKEGWQDVVECKVVDAQDTGLESSSFDVVLMFYGPHCLPDPNAGLRETHRLLKPNGLLVSTTPYDLTVWDIVNEAHDRTLMLRPDGGDKGKRGQHVFKTADMMKSWVDVKLVEARVHKELGWANAKVETNKVTTFVADWEGLFKSFHSNPGMAFIYGGLNDEERAVMIDEMMKVCRGRAGEGRKGMEMDITSAIVTVTKE